MANAAPEKALEKAPFYLVAALYASVVAAGFGADTPPLGPIGLFLAALTLVVFGHLLNAYQVATLRAEYPTPALIVDFLLIGVLALMFNLLAHPGAGSFFRFVPPWIDADQFLASTTERSLNRDDLRQLFNHFFGLALFLLVFFIAWHLSMWRWCSAVTLKKPIPYALGWLLFAGLSIFGIFRTASPIANDAQWNGLVVCLNLLAGIALVASALFLVCAKAFDWTYGPSNNAAAPAGRSTIAKEP